MESPEKLSMCASIEKHIKELILQRSPQDQSTPTKTDQGNKNYEENFPTLNATQSHSSSDPSSKPHGNSKSPRKLRSANRQQHPPVKNAEPKAHLSQSNNQKEINGYDCFPENNPMNFRGDSFTKRGNKSPDKTRLRNSLPEDYPRFVKNYSPKASGFAKTQQSQEGESVDISSTAHCEGSARKESQAKQKKKMKRKEKREQQKREQTKLEDGNKSVLDKLSVKAQTLQLLERSLNLDVGGRDMKRNQMKIERPKKPDFESAQQRLDLEIMKEKKRLFQQGCRNRQSSFNHRLASVPEDLKKMLESEHLFPLKEPSNRFPSALFYCHLCHYHCDMGNYQKHIKQSNHVSQKNVRLGEFFLKNLPYPAEAQCSAITKLLQNVASEFGLSSNEVKQRQEIADGLTQFIQDNGLPQCQFQLCGSSLSGFATKESDLNLNLIYPSVEVLPVILELPKILKSNEQLSDVTTDFESKIPKILFKDLRTGLKCNITWDNNGTVKTSQLLATYMSMDPRVQVLGVAFRLWAKICKIDCPEKGTLSPHYYAIMLIYFLQQIEPPVLPVLHVGESNPDSEKSSKKEKLDGTNMEPEETSKEGKMTGKWTCQNKQSIGELWIDLFRFYVVTFNAAANVVSIQARKKMTKAERKWNVKVIAIEDPYFKKHSLSRSILDQAVYWFIQERFRETYKYFAVPQIESGPLFETLEPEILKRARKGRSLEPCSESSNFSSPEEQDEDDDCETDLDWRRRKVGETSRDSHDFEGHDSSSSEDDLLADQDPEVKFEDLRALENFDLGDSDHDGKCRTESESSDAYLHLNDLEMESPAPKVNCGSPARKVAIGSKSAEKTAKKRPDSPPCPFIVDLMSSFQESDLNYMFNRLILTNGKSPPIYCRECEAKDHLKDDCPSLTLPTLIELKPLPKNYILSLDQVCIQAMYDNVPSSDETEYREALLTDLEKHIRQVFPDANLELFGSSCNGFVFDGSDLDVCLTFTDKKGEGLIHTDIFEKLAKSLKKHGDLQNILPITTAKVPIVKFNHRKLDVECDISLYNTLAQHNTRMLLTYCQIDERVRVLGYTTKLFAKLCDIGDASRGSLSSYAYILMVLYFLQQRKPPVIPVLQELFPKDESPPELIVDNWNAWFYDDMENLYKVWPERGENKESIGELWIGLLRFYTEEFNFKEHVVCIRRKALLTRIEKAWYSKKICIEDPFDLNHNLGVGVSRKMSIYIMKAMIRGRELFGTAVEHISSINLKDHLFDKTKLVMEAPPNDRGCRACGKIGHKVKDCPFRKNARTIQQSRRQEQLQQQLYYDMQRGFGLARVNNQLKMDSGRLQGRKPENHPLFIQNKSNKLQLVQPILQHLASKFPKHTQTVTKSNTGNMQLQQQQQHIGSPNQRKGDSSRFNDSRAMDSRKFCAALPVGIHPMHKMTVSQPHPQSWPNSNPRPNLGLVGSPPNSLLPPPVLERTPRRDNSNPSPSSPVQALPQPSHQVTYFQGQGPFPLTYPMATSAGSLGTPPLPHGVPYLPPQMRTLLKPVGREEQQLMCRPPAPPPFSHSVWAVNGSSYSPSPSQPPPPHVNPNSPIRPVVIPAPGSNPTLLGTSPQQVAGIPANYQHMTLSPENSVNNNRTLLD